MAATTNGESETISISDFTLNDFVPKNPFFSYTALLPYQPCVGNADYIVFGVAKSACQISTDTLTKLKSIITANSYTIKTGPLLFYNSKGPGLSGSDEIYIDCQPTGASEEEVDVTTVVSTTTPITIDSILNSPSFQFIVCFLIIVAIIYLLKTFITLSTNMMEGKSFELKSLHPFKT